MVPYCLPTAAHGIVQSLPIPVQSQSATIVPSLRQPHSHPYRKLSFGSHPCRHRALPYSAKALADHHSPRPETSSLHQTMAEGAKDPIVRFTVALCYKVLKSLRRGRLPKSADLEAALRSCALCYDLFARKEEAPLGDPTAALAVNIASPGERAPPGDLNDLDRELDRGAGAAAVDDDAGPDDDSRDEQVPANNLNSSADPTNPPLPMTSQGSTSSLVHVNAAFSRLANGDSSSSSSSSSSNHDSDAIAHPPLMRCTHSSYWNLHNLVDANHSPILAIATPLPEHLSESNILVPWTNGWGVDKISFRRNIMSGDHDRNILSLSILSGRRSYSQQPPTLKLISQQKQTPRLPPELLSQIFSHFASPPRIPEDQLTLASCCRVSKSWYGPAAAELWRDPLLPTASSIGRLVIGGTLASAHLSRRRGAGQIHPGTRLIKMDLSGVELRDKESARALLRALWRGTRCVDLQDLRLRADHVQQATLQRFFRSCPKLEILYLRGGVKRRHGWSEASIAELRAGFARLHTLTLERIEGRESGREVCELVASSVGTNLKWLDLWGTGIGDGFLAQIALKCPNLGGIWLGQCDAISDNGIEALARGCPKLRILAAAVLPRIADHGVTDAGLEVIIASCPRLSVLDLSMTRCTAATIWALARANPPPEVAVVPPLRSLWMCMPSGPRTTEHRASTSRALCTLLERRGGGLRDLSIAGLGCVDPHLVNAIARYAPCLERLNLGVVSASVGEEHIRSIIASCTKLETLIARIDLTVHLVNGLDAANGNGNVNGALVAVNNNIGANNNNGGIIINGGIADNHHTRPQPFALLDRAGWKGSREEFWISRPCGWRSDDDYFRNASRHW
ncbi:hypothetical protein SeMB42_g02703 [Synchytrium endobioticum]|uniref:F-box domain-containing protein n=1 Tax=Synchytrium endobioticum TaxID=286115 RepID=A0A507DCY8_9FUNG|nr:hypothetical protein SeMB42_g02703 [Synchytrium endobioticum]